MSYEDDDEAQPQERPPGEVPEFLQPAAVTPTPAHWSQRGVSGDRVPCPRCGDPSGNRYPSDEDGVEVCVACRSLEEDRAGQAALGAPPDHIRKKQSHN